MNKISLSRGQRWEWLGKKSSNESDVIKDGKEMSKKGAESLGSPEN